jgi:hypothetical protein
MKPNNKQHSINHWLIIFIFLFFIGANVFFFRAADGDDLSSSYIACRILTLGEKEHLYSHDSQYFHIVSDLLWSQIASETSFNGFLHPYTQTPLWAYSLIPLCKAADFQTFNLIFLILNFSAIAGTIWLTAHQWARIFLTKPLFLIGFLFIFSLMVPTYYMAFLNQTHPIFLFATVLAIYLAAKEKNLPAGLALSIAASVKLTPAIVAVHWLISGKRKSAFAFLIWSFVLSALSVIVLGWKTNLDHLFNLARMSNILLVSFNNQSLAAWLFGQRYGPSEIMYWRMFPLPAFAKIAGLGLILCVVAYFALKYHREQNVEYLEVLSIASLLVASTIFTPIVWTHYYIILLIPIMFLIDWGIRSREKWAVIIAAVLISLNLWPLAIDPLHPEIHPFTILRSHFYAGMICLCTLIYVSQSASFRRSKVDTVNHP